MVYTTITRVCGEFKKFQYKFVVTPGLGVFLDEMSEYSRKNPGSKKWDRSIVYSRTGFGITRSRQSQEPKVPDDVIEEAISEIKSKVVFKPQ